MVEKVYPAGAGYDGFKKKIAKMTGVDLSVYKYQIHRRVHTLMRNWEIADYEEFFRLLTSDKGKLRDFLDYITINVTEFFRNGERWKVLEETVVPELQKIKTSRLNLWSAGCSTGEEAYSLAMLAMENGLHFKALAVDVDEGVLEKARIGRYEAAKVEKMPESIVRRYFSRKNNGFYEINNHVKANMYFRRFNLLGDSFPENQHLVLCRNVVIYFSAETKKRLYLDFSRCLAPGGYLMVGATEQIFECAEIGLESVGSFLYKKVLSK